MMLSASLTECLTLEVSCQLLMTIVKKAVNACSDQPHRDGARRISSYYLPAYELQDIDLPLCLDRICITVR